MNTYNDMIIFEAPQMFSVPTSIVDKHINAGYNEIRLILLLLRNVNMGFSKETLLNRLSMTEEDLNDAFDFWVKEGVLFKQGEKYVLERPRIRSTDVMTYTAEDVAERIDKDHGILFLYKKTEDVLAKPLTTADASVILSLVDWVGLPSEVVALLLQYCVDCGKKSLRQIEKTGIEWAEKEINTAERAEEYIEAERRKREVINEYCHVLGITGRALTDSEKKTFASWSENMGYDSEIIAEAFNATVRATGKYSYQYMDKIISNWFKQGVKTVEEAQKSSADTKPKAKRTTKRFEPTSTTDTVSAIESTWAIIEGELGNTGKGGN